MSDDEELLRLANDLTPLDLPIAMYIVRPDGRFVKCNRRARGILRLPLEGDLENISIASFYANPRDREELHRELQIAEAKGRDLEKLISLEVEGQEVIIRDFTRSLKDADDNLRGYVCCMIDVTEAERSNRLLDSLPAGVYKLDANDKCETANRAFARILGYDRPEEIDGRASSEFYVDPTEAARLQQLVKDKDPEPVTNFIAEMHRKDGAKIFVHINAHMVKADDGSYAGREGTMMDVTRQERYRRILRDVPVGLNVIREDGGRDLIEDCNEQFLELFDFPYQDPLKAKGFDARDLYASTEEYLRFKKELQAKAKHGRPITGHRVKVKTLRGEHKIVEISSQPLLDRFGKIIGRTGAVRDITSEAELRDRLDELTHDFGSVLHNYTTTLLMVQLSSDPVIRSLAPDPFPSDAEVTPELADEAMAQPASVLADGLAQLLDLAREEGRSPALPEEKWTRLRTVLSMLRNYGSEIAVPEFRPSVLGEAALEVIECCNLMLTTHRFPRESVNNVRNTAQTLVRIANLVSLHHMRDAVLEMDHQVRSLREFVTTSAREPEAREVCGTTHLLRQVRSNLADYARNRRVELKIEGEDAKVKVVRREVLRALTDLLHNAIKYTWSRDKTKMPWITIRTRVADGFVHIEFKNWGVPIQEEEIDEGLIFKIGYRGMHSGDRGRVGTGIGLADARHVARAHRGDIEVTSQPSVGSRQKDDYSSPFITTVTMKLPLELSQGAANR